MPLGDSSEDPVEIAETKRIWIESHSQTDQLGVDDRLQTLKELSRVNHQRCTYPEEEACLIDVTAMIQPIDDFVIGPQSALAAQLGATPVSLGEYLCYMSDHRSPADLAIKVAQVEDLQSVREADFYGDRGGGRTVSESGRTLPQLEATMIIMEMTATADVARRRRSCHRSMKQ